MPLLRFIATRLCAVCKLPLRKTDPMSEVRCPLCGLIWK